ncbi:MAG: tetratricopeptide repeat protein [Gemmatimonadota bacterium]|nr:MAG: tetratricopeptide repeat protein [Gemmatimonadota bacterium]
MTQLCRATAVVTLALGLLGLITLIVWNRSWTAVLLTPDQRAQRLADQSRFVEAAELFSDPLRRGAALYRSGDFKAAASAFTRSNVKEAYFNRGNALVMLGKYDDAIEAYDRALEMQPGWSIAVKNRELAALRAERVKREGGEMTGGKLEADEIVFEPGKKGDQPSDQTETTSGGEQLSDEALQALWLRRVQTKGADFLRAKFAFQLAEQGATPSPEDRP